MLKRFIIFQAKQQQQKLLKPKPRYSVFKKYYHIEEELLQEFREKNNSLQRLA